MYLIFSGAKVNPESLEPSPDVADIDASHSDFRLINLKAFITMKLTSDRRKDHVHLLDMIEIGMLGESGLARPTQRRE